MFALAREYGWTGEVPLELDRDAYCRVPAAEPSPSGKLTIQTMTTLKQAFAQQVPAHEPSEAQLGALEDLASKLEGMAENKLDPLIYLCTLDPGVGKTQTIIHFVRHLIASEEHKDVGIVICVGRLAEIETLVAEMRLEKSEYAVLVSDGPQARYAELNALGNQSKTSARLLFITHQMLESRSGRNNGSFNAVPEFHYNGQLRRVKIWDESILPARTISVPLTSIEALKGDLAVRYPKLYKAIEGLVDDARDMPARNWIDVPNFAEDCGVDEGRALSIFSDEDESPKGEESNYYKRIKRTVVDLWALSGNSVLVVAEGPNRFLVSYERTLPDDLKPVIVCDASGRVRNTYSLWSETQGDIVRLAHADKDYAPLVVHLWRKGGSKYAFLNDSASLLNEMANLVNSSADTERWLIVHHLHHKKRFNIDIPGQSTLRITNPNRVHFVHWGGEDFKATNQYRRIKNIILAGTLFYGTDYYVGATMQSKNLSHGEQLLPEEVRRVELGEHAHVILQAACRGSVRLSEGDKCAPCNLYIIAHPSSGIPGMLENGYIFPGAKPPLAWGPTSVKLPRLVKKAVKFIVGWLRKRPKETLSSAKVRRHLDIPDTIGGRANFQNDIIDHPTFEAALALEGISIERQKGRRGSYFSKRQVSTMKEVAKDGGFNPTF